LHRVFAKANREERAVLQGTSLRDLLRGSDEEEYLPPERLVPVR
jgi:hypothetical protein